MEEHKVNYFQGLVFFFGVHPLRMTMTSSSTLKVGFAVAEEANA